VAKVKWWQKFNGGKFNGGKSLMVANLMVAKSNHFQLKQVKG
jgi:hypothetical protein